jgi:hypothetical protein
MVHEARRHRRALKRVSHHHKACDPSLHSTRTGTFDAYKQLSKRRSSPASGARISNNKQALASVV